MMESKDSTGKDMMAKLKESFSLKSFSSRRYHSSLICNSKTIRMDVNLIGKNVSTSTRTLSSSDFNLMSSGNESGKNGMASSRHEKGVGNTKVNIKSGEASNIMKRTPKNENLEELVMISKDSLKSSNENRKQKLEASVKHSYQAQNHSSVNQTEIKARLKKSVGKSKIKNKSAKSSKIMKKPSKIENVKDLVMISRDSLSSPNEDRKGKLKASVKHSFQAKNRGLVNQIKTKSKRNDSEYESLRCDICMKYFTSKRGVIRHRVLHSSERHPCEACSKVFRTSDNLKRHFRVVHDVKVKSMQCTKCFKAYSNRSCLNRHLKKRPDHVQLNSSPRNDELVFD